MKTNYLALIVLSLLALMAGSGCNTTKVKPRAFEVVLIIDKPLVGTSLQVDLIGANSLADLPKWTTYSVTEYWQPDNPIRRDDAHLCAQFGRGLAPTVTISREHPHWQAWIKSGVAHLVIMADLPGVSNDQIGNADPRRLIIPLDKKLWNRKAPLEILIQEGGIKLLSKQLSEQK